LIIVLLALLVVGMVILIFMLGTGRMPFGNMYNYYNRPSSYSGSGMGGIMYPEEWNFSYDKTDFESNGELIYYTGYNESGSLIPIEYGPRWIYIHGGSCVNCHGTDGKGGSSVMMSFAVPPDIRYNVLTSEEHADGEEEHPAYNNETIKQAIRDGIDPAGESLDLTMPRWKMSDSDMNDLLEYLEKL
jgi:cytochrome c oxidase subunit 2